MPRPALLAAALLVAPPTAVADFERDVAPILLANCVECHSGATPSGDLDLTTKTEFAATDATELLGRVTKGEMPPPKQGKPRPLPAADVAKLRAWVDAGAKWPDGRTLDPFEATTATRAGRDWWSLQPIARPAVPGGGNPVDAFVGAKLRERSWEPAPSADRRTLIRRVYFDLLGLPPTFEEIEAFANDASADAYEKLVDRLLASPHYGERWGRHWLDVARYAETCGYERDQVKPHVWKYRDWVVKAFNDDLPFATFVRHQLAGDEVPERSEASVVATGFVRLGTWNDEPNDPAEYTYDRLEDMVGATTTAFLAMTVKCARCHDHKFDPIRQTDYYRLAAAFWAGPVGPDKRELLGGPDAKRLGFDAVFGWTDRGPDAQPIRLLAKGDPARPGAVVGFGHLSMVPALDRAAPAPPAGATTTQRRLRLAEWITDPKNPLAARVWVNRVWQHHFGKGLVRTPDNFGFTGERPTHPELLDRLASEFLANGGRTKPLHRIILTSRTYRQASIHPAQERYAAADAGNRMWWRAERRRLDAESLRDALLAAGGSLKLTPMGGPSFSPDIPPDALEGLSTKAAAWTPSPPAEQGRRSLYAFSKRGLLVPLLTTFDLPDTTLPACQRDVTTVTPQALALLNNPFVHRQSEALAARCGTGPASEQVRRAWRLALGRDPTPTESTAALAHLAEQGRRTGPDRALASLAHVLLNTNEFAYVD